MCMHFWVCELECDVSYRSVLGLERLKCRPWQAVLAAAEIGVSR